MNEILAIYLAGYVAAVITLLLSWGIREILISIMGKRIVNRNIQKLDPKTFTDKLISYSWIIGASALFSWIQVVMTIVATIYVAIKDLIELFKPVPEKVLKLRFALHTNPDMSVEEVWARVIAIYSLLSVSITEADIEEDLQKHSYSLPSFNEELAMNFYSKLQQS